MQDPNLNKKIASVALAYHLDSSDNMPKIVATSALAMYLNSSCGNNKSKIIAQIALALFLENNPNASFSAPSIRVTGAINNSSWNSKILMMRQMPIRK